MTSIKSAFLRAAEVSLKEELTFVAEVRSTIRARLNLDPNTLNGKKIAEAMDQRYYLYSLIFFRLYLEGSHVKKSF